MTAQDINTETVGFRLSAQQAWLLGTEGRRSVVQCAAALTGPIDAVQCSAALSQLSARYEILRTTFPRTAGLRDRSQLIHPSLTPEWRCEPAGAAAALGDHEQLTGLMAAEAELVLDLEHGPLVRALLLSPQDERCLLVLTADAACADADSLLLLVGELTEILASRSLPEEPVQYADYAEWRHALLTGDDEAAVEGREVWRAHADWALGTPQRPAGAEDGDHDARPAAIGLEAGELAALHSAAGGAGVPVAVFLEAAWHALMARLSDSGEVVLAGWCDGRSQPDLEGTVGPYAQPVPIRTHVAADTSFAEVLDQVNRARVEQTTWQDFASAEDLSGLEGNVTGAFVHTAVPAAVSPVGAIASVRAVPVSGLVLSVLSQRDELRAEVWSDRGTAHAGEVAGRFGTLLTAAVIDPAAPVALFPLVDAAERDALIAAAAGPAATDQATTPFHHLFERVAADGPERVAVTAGGERLTYAELGAAANRLAHLLREAGLGKSEAVGLCLERTPALLVGILGIVKAGGAYLPLNYEHPAPRLEHQLSESGTRFLITEEHLRGRLPEFAGETICLDADRDRIAAFADTDPESVAGPEDLVYIMYTSGSTGLPKGVKVTHANLANYATDMARRLTAGEPASLRFGVVSAISTDLGNTCIFPPLVSGGSVHMVSPGAAMDSAAMAGELQGEPLDVLKITPSHLGALLAGEAAAAILPRRWLIVGGEALSWELVEQVRSLSPACEIINHYGPTETTIGACAYDVGAPRGDSATVPIGRPLAGARAYVLDRGLAPVPPGVPGELCLAGAGVAAGYVAADGGAAGPFVPDPFTAGPARMYRTGDRVRRLADGSLEFLGRIDDQVKIRGYRIEPAEIEAVLSRHPTVRQAAVVPEADERGQLRLVAYITASGEPTVEELQSFLGQSLPDYMVPGTFSKLESFPFTPSGKVDRQALAAQGTDQLGRETSFVAPRDEIEAQIAGIWGELLGVEQVGVFDDFFALGGHSLMATQAIMRIRREHGNIPLRALLAAPTVATLADVVRGGPIGAAGSTASP